MKYLSICTFILIFTLLARDIFAQTTDIVQQNSASNDFIISDDNLLIVEVRIDRLKTNEALEIFQYEGGYLVPLGLLSDILGFSVDINSETGQANGWFINEKKTFSLDINSRQVIIQGEKRMFDSLSTTYYNDIYIDSSAFSSWFPVDLNVDYSNLLMKIHPREKLPFQKRLEREKTRGRLSNYIDEQKYYKNIISPDYKLYDLPFVDLNMGYNYNNNAAESNLASYSALASGDLLYHTGSLLLSGASQEGLETIRVNLGRQDYQGNLLGKLKATQYSFGDINSASLPLTTTSGTGRGVILSNFSLDASDQFDSTNFIGDTPPGWEVEIYQNGALLDFQIVDLSGQYEFTNVPIFFGNNNFRIVSYGPEGQIREESFSYLIDDAILNKGEFRYRTSIDEKSLSLFTVNEDQDQINHPDSIRTVIDTKYGISDNLTVGLGFARTPLNDGKIHDYIHSSFHASAKGVLLNGDLVYDNKDDSTASRLILNTQYKDVNIKAQQSFFDKFVSEELSSGTFLLKSDSQLDIDGQIPLWLSSSMAYRLSAQYERFNLGRNVYSLSKRLSTSIFGFSLGNNINYRLVDDLISSENTQGNFSIRSRFKDISIRLSSNYELHPESQIISNNAVFQKQLGRRSNIRFGIRKDLAGEENTSFDISYNHLLKYATLSMVASADDNDNFSVGTRLSFSIGHEPRNNSFIMDGENFASEGAVSALAYKDNNFNLNFDDGDEIMSDIGFKANGRDYPGSEDKSPVFVRRLDTNKPSNIEIDYTTIEDPYLMPVQDGVSVFSRAGNVTMVDFPIHATTEIDGNVYLTKKGTSSPISRIVLQLVDSNDNIVKTTRSEFDGFYLFEKVIPGEYKITVADKSLDKFDADNYPQIPLSIPLDSDIISGINIDIKDGR